MVRHAAGAGMSDVASLGEISAVGLREVFPEWRIFCAGGAWWATRGGLQRWTGPESLLLRVISAADLVALAERLCVQSWLGVALLQGPAELGRCWLTGYDDVSSPTVSGRSEEMPDGFADRGTAAA
jgi:hypothetical protein